MISKNRTPPQLPRDSSSSGTLRRPSPQQPSPSSNHGSNGGQRVSHAPSISGQVNSGLQSQGRAQSVPPFPAVQASRPKVREFAPIVQPTRDRPLPPPSSREHVSESKSLRSIPPGASVRTLQSSSMPPPLSTQHQHHSSSLRRSLPVESVPSRRNFEPFPPSTGPIPYQHVSTGVLRIDPIHSTFPNTMPSTSSSWEPSMSLMPEDFFSTDQFSLAPQHLPGIEPMQQFIERPSSFRPHPQNVNAHLSSMTSSSSTSDLSNSSYPHPTQPHQYVSNLSSTSSSLHHETDAKYYSDVLEGFEIDSSDLAGDLDLYAWMNTNSNDSFENVAVDQRSSSSTLPTDTKPDSVSHAGFQSLSVGEFGDKTESRSEMDVASSVAVDRMISRTSVVASPSPAVSKEIANRLHASEERLALYEEELGRLGQELIEKQGRVGVLSGKVDQLTKDLTEAKNKLVSERSEREVKSQRRSNFPDAKEYEQLRSQLSLLREQAAENEALRKQIHEVKQKYSQLETRYSAGISSSIPVEEPVITRTPRTTSTRHGSDDSLRNELLAKHALQAPSQTLAPPSLSKPQAFNTGKTFTNRSERQNGVSPDVVSLSQSRMDSPLMMDLDEDIENAIRVIDSQKRTSSEIAVQTELTPSSVEVNQDTENPVKRKRIDDSQSVVSSQRSEMPSQPLSLAPSRGSASVVDEIPLHLQRIFGLHVYPVLEWYRDSEACSTVEACLFSFRGSDVRSHIALLDALIRFLDVVLKENEDATFRILSAIHGLLSVSIPVRSSVWGTCEKKQQEMSCRISGLTSIEMSQFEQYSLLSLSNSSLYAFQATPTSPCEELEVVFLMDSLLAAVQKDIRMSEIVGEIISMCDTHVDIRNDKTVSVCESLAKSLTTALLSSSSSLACRIACLRGLSVLFSIEDVSSMFAGSLRRGNTLAPFSSHAPNCSSQFFSSTSGSNQIDAEDSSATLKIVDKLSPEKFVRRSSSMKKVVRSNMSGLSSVDTLEGESNSKNSHPLSWSVMELRCILSLIKDPLDDSDFSVLLSEVQMRRAVFSFFSVLISSQQMQQEIECADSFADSSESGISGTLIDHLIVIVSGGLRDILSFFQRVSFSLFEPDILDSPIALSVIESSCLCFEGGLALLFEFTSLFRPSGSMIPQICGAILSVSERLGLYQWFSLDMLSESSELSSRMDCSFWSSEDQSLSGESISVRIQSMIQSFLTSHRIRALAFRISARILPMEVWKEKLMLKDGTNRKSLNFVDVDEDVLP